MKDLTIDLLKSLKIKLPLDFVKSLRGRVRKLQKNFKPDETKEYKGALFKDFELIFESVIYNVIYAHENPSQEKTVDGYAQKLTFKKDLVTDGSYDLVITEVLRNFSQIDYKKEKTVDFH